MSRLAETASVNVRHAQQRHVAALLDEIAARRRRLYVLKAYGVRKAGMRSLKDELTAVRDELAEVTNAAPTARTQPSDVNTGAHRPSAPGSTREKPANLGRRRRSSAGRALHS